MGSELPNAVMAITILIFPMANYMCIKILIRFRLCEIQAFFYETFFTECS